MNILGFIDVIFYLTPGIIISMLVRSLSVPEKNKSETSIIIESFIYAMVVYWLHRLIPFTTPIVLSKDKIPDVVSLSVMIGLCVIIAFIHSFLQNSGVLMDILQKLKITRNTSHPTVWNEVFGKKRRYVIVNFVQGSRLKGYPELYSDDPESPYLYISNAEWLYTDKDNQLQSVPLDDNNGILVTPEHKIKFIEFLKHDGES